MSIWSREWKGFGFENRLIESSMRFVEDESKPQISLEAISEDVIAKEGETKEVQAVPEEPKAGPSTDSDSQVPQTTEPEPDVPVAPAPAETPVAPVVPVAPATPVVAPAGKKQDKKKRKSPKKPRKVEPEDNEDSESSEAEVASTFDLPRIPSEESEMRESEQKREQERKKQEEQRKKAPAKPTEQHPRKFSAQDIPIKLDKNQFFQSVPNEKFLVMFYSPNCQHCHEFLPTFSRLGKELINEAYFATVDCLENSRLCSDAGVSYFPSLYLYYDNKYVELTGGRNEQNIRNAVSDDEYFLDKKSKAAFVFDKHSARWYWADDVFFLSCIDATLFRGLAAILLLVLAVVYCRRRSAFFGVGKSTYSTLCEVGEYETEMSSACHAMRLKLSPRTGDDQSNEGELKI